MAAALIVVVLPTALSVHAGQRWLAGRLLGPHGRAPELALAVLQAVVAFPTSLLASVAAGLRVAAPLAVVAAPAWWLSDAIELPGTVQRVIGAVVVVTLMTGVRRRSPRVGRLVEDLSGWFCSSGGRLRGRVFVLCAVAALMLLVGLQSRLTWF